MTGRRANPTAARCSLGRWWGTFVGVATLLGAVLACGLAAPSDSPAAAATPAGVVSPASTAPAVAIGPSPTVAGRDAPPDAFLAAEGGDPVAGQLGTFVWFETGSDSPWLPGFPLTVGAGEPLTVRLVPDDGVLAWTARFVPAAVTGPDGAMSLGEGSGSARFAAPGPGTWTVEVFTEFGAGAGNAHYFWRLEVE